MPVESSSLSRTRLVALGCAGAAAFGAAEVARVVLAGRLGLGWIGVGALIPLSLAFSVAIGWIPVALLAQFPALRRTRGTWAWLLGAAVPGLLSLAEWWFTDPPPFQDPMPWQGQPLAFAAVAAVVAALVMLLSFLTERLRHGPRTLAGVMAAVVALVVWFEAPLQPPAAVGNPPNLLLVTLDTTRADRFIPGEGRIDTPAFDELVAAGARFDAAFAQIPVTGPSHTTLLTGVGPWSHGSLLNGVPLPEQLPVLAEVLRDAGYRTAAFPSAYVLSGGLGFSRGFQVYDDDFSWVKGSERLLPGRLWALVGRHLDPSHVLERRADLTVDRAERWLRRQDGPFFAWVHLFDAHGPYAPPPPYDQRFYEGVDPRDPENTSMDEVSGVAPYLAPSLEGITDVRWVRAQYDGEVAFVDSQVARLLALLEDEQLAEDTLVVIVGDHGEGLGEQGEWFNHGDFLYEHDLHVPLGMRLPGRVAQGTVVTAPVELGDLMPTMLELLGHRVPDTVEGASLTELLAGGAPPRPMVRAIAFDREANRIRREADPTFKPTWRMVSARDHAERVVLREDTAFDAVVQEATTGEVEVLSPVVLPPLAEEGSEDPADAALRALALRRQALVMAAEELMGDAAGAERSQVELSDEERQMLEAMGYLD